MLSGSWRAAVAILALSIASGGCVVLSSRYEEKSREADSLRDAIAVSNREQAAAAARGETLRKELDEEKKRAAALDTTCREQEASIRKAAEELAVARKSYEGTRITREQLVTELLEKEKATGTKIQELGARALQCDAERDKMRREAEARDKEIAELRRKADRPSAEEELRRERDVLLGRVERLTDERRQDERRRDERFGALAATLARTAPGTAAASAGPVFRLAIPGRVLAAPGNPGLSEAAASAVLEVGRAAAELPSAAVVVSAETPETADAIKSLLAAKAGVPGGRIAAAAREGTRGAEILLVVP